MQLNTQAQMRETDKDIAADIHYPDCWDTAAYPRLIDALRQLAHCVGCKECEAAQQNTTSAAKYTREELLELALNCGVGTATGLQVQSVINALIEAGALQVKE